MTDGQEVYRNVCPFQPLLKVLPPAFQGRHARVNIDYRPKIWAEIICPPWASLSDSNGYHHLSHGGILAGGHKLIVPIMMGTIPRAYNFFDEIPGDIKSDIGDALIANQIQTSTQIGRFDFTRTQTYRASEHGRFLHIDAVPSGNNLDVGFP